MSTLPKQSANIADLMRMADGVMAPGNRHEDGAASMEHAMRELSATLRPTGMAASRAAFERSGSGTPPQEGPPRHLASGSGSAASDSDYDGPARRGAFNTSGSDAGEPELFGRIDGHDAAPAAAAARSAGIPSRLTQRALNRSAWTSIRAAPKWLQVVACGAVFGLAVLPESSVLAVLLRALHVDVGAEALWPEGYRVLLRNVTLSQRFAFVLTSAVLVRVALTLRLLVIDACPQAVLRAVATAACAGATAGIASPEAAAAAIAGVAERAAITTSRGSQTRVGVALVLLWPALEAAMAVRSCMRSALESLPAKAHPELDAAVHAAFLARAAVYVAQMCVLPAAAAAAWRWRRDIPRHRLAAPLWMLRTYAWARVACALVLSRQHLMSPGGAAMIIGAVAATAAHNYYAHAATVPTAEADVAGSLSASYYSATALVEPLAVAVQNPAAMSTAAARAAGYLTVLGMLRCAVVVPLFMIVVVAVLCGAYAVELLALWGLVFMLLMWVPAATAAFCTDAFAIIANVASAVVLLWLRSAAAALAAAAMTNAAPPAPSNDWESLSLLQLVGPEAVASGYFAFGIFNGLAACSAWLILLRHWGAATRRRDLPRRTRMAAAGRIVAVSGFAVCAAAVWMALYSTHATHQAAGPVAASAAVAAPVVVAPVQHAGAQSDLAAAANDTAMATASRSSGEDETASPRGSDATPGDTADVAAVVTVGEAMDRGALAAAQRLHDLVTADRPQTISFDAAFATGLQGVIGVIGPILGRVGEAALWALRQTFDLPAEVQLPPQRDALAITSFVAFAAALLVARTIPPAAVLPATATSGRFFTATVADLRGVRLVYRIAHTMSLLCVLYACVLVGTAVAWGSMQTAAVLRPQSTAAGVVESAGAWAAGLAAFVCALGALKDTLPHGAALAVRCVGAEIAMPASTQRGDGRDLSTG